MSRPPSILTITAAWRAVTALRELHRVCTLMDSERTPCHGVSPHEYDAAMREAAAAVRACPQPAEKESTS